MNSAMDNRRHIEEVAAQRNIVLFACSEEFGFCRGSKTVVRFNNDRLIFFGVHFQVLSCSYAGSDLNCAFHFQVALGWRFTLGISGKLREGEREVVPYPTLSKKLVGQERGDPSCDK